MNLPASINADLAMATTIKRMEFATDLRTGRCTLLLELLDDDRRPAVQVIVEAHGVAEWSAQGLGGGITQLLCLRAKDISDQQHDRVRFLLEDLENRALSLKCEELTTTRVSVDR